jgi:hypothetical protein
MRRKWSIELLKPSVDRFIADHGMNIHDICIQSFLGADISWKHTADGWLISLYPRMYYDGPTEETILHALSLINRRLHPWFEETPADEFNRLTRQLLDERRSLNPMDREAQAREIVAIDRALCSALDLYYLLTRGYLNVHEVRSLADYRLGHFISPQGAVELLAAAAVLKMAGDDLSELYKTLISNKWYDLLPILDRVEDCIRSNRVVHVDSVAVFDTLLPYFKEQGFLDTIAVLRRNVLGPRDDSEIDFNVAISYAGEDREVVEPIAATLVRERIRVFYDRYMEPELWGKDLHQHLTDVYRRRARFCVMVISSNYASKLWPTIEREAAVARAVSENLDYILPLRLDDTVVPGLPASLVYVDLRSRTQECASDIIVKRVRLVG